MDKPDGQKKANDANRAANKATLVVPRNSGTHPIAGGTPPAAPASVAQSDSRPSTGTEQTLINSNPGGGAPGGGLDNTVITDQRPPSSHGARPDSRAPSSGGAPGSGFVNSDTLNLSVPLQDLSGEGMLSQARRIPFDSTSVPSLGGIPLLHKLGQGGMGAVYYGIHPGLRIEVAVKVLPLALAQPQMIQRFYREAQIAAKIQSPHLVAVRDVSEDSGLYYLVMEYITGMSAGSFMRRRKKEGVHISEADALEIVIAATEGLAVAHRKGIIHRDIKPDNVLIPKSERPGQDLSFADAKLADLGLARNEEGAGGLTGTSSGLGTPGYMAPEQAADASKVKKAADVWSMGSTLYGLLAARPPFRGDTPINIIMASMQSPHDPLPAERPDVSKATNRLIDICLSKSATERYVDGPALLEALKVCRAALNGGDAAQERAIKQLGEIQKAAEQGLPLPALDEAALSGKREAAMKPALPGQKKSGSPVGLILGVVALLAVATVGIIVLKGQQTAQDEDQIKKTLSAEEQERRRLQKEVDDLRMQLQNVQSQSLSPEQQQASAMLMEAFNQLQKDGDLSDAEAKVGLAQLGFPNHPGLPMVQKLLSKKKDEAAKAAEQKKRAAFDGHLKSATDALNAANALDALKKVEAELAEADKLYPNDEKVQAARRSLETQRKKLEDQEREQKKRTQFDSLIKDAEAAFAKDGPDAAEPLLAQPALLYPSDKKVSDLRQKIETRRKELAEQKKQTEYSTLYKETEELIPQLRDLTAANNNIAKLDTILPKDPRTAELQKKVESRKAQVAEEARRATFKQLITDGTAAVGTSLSAAEGKAAEAAKLYPNDAELAGLNAAIAKRKADIAEADRQQRFNGFIGSAEGSIKQKQWAAADSAVNDAEKLYPQDRRISELRRKIKDGLDDERRAREAALAPVREQVKERMKPGENKDD